MSYRRVGRWRWAGLLLGLSACIPAGRPVALPAPADLARHLSGMIWPLPVQRAASVTSEFGARGRSHHAGLDVDGRTGDPVFAVRDGRVKFSGWRPSYGETVVLDHGGGVTTLYGHASARWVEAGDSVRRGQVIAAVGATGNARGDHLHFEVAWAGASINPLTLLPRVDPR